MLAGVDDYDDVGLRGPLRIQPHGISGSEYCGPLPLVQECSEQCEEEGEDVLVALRGGRMHYDPPVEVLPVAVLVRQTVELFLVHAWLDDQIWRLESGLHGRDYNRFHAVAAQVSKAGLICRTAMSGRSCRLRPELRTA